MPADAFEKHAAAARTNLLVYAQLQARKYAPGRMHAYVAAHLAAIERGDLQRLMVFTPPQHGKTTLLAFFLAWSAGRHPDWPIVFATYSAERAEDVSMKVRELLLSPAHAKVFPNGGIAATGSASMRRMSLAGGGTLYAVGVGGGLTGRSAELLVIDDPVKDREAADSEAVQRHTADWYDNVARTRLSPTGRQVIVMTRWNEKDLCGHILATNGSTWTVVSLPALAEANDPLGRAEGEALWPERGYTRDFLLQVQRDIGARAWAALYQQRPSPLEGGIWKRAWLRYYTVPPGEIHDTIISADLAFKGDTTSDFVALHVWARTGSQAYLLDRVHDRMDFPTTVQAFRQLAARWPSAGAKLVEDKANGPALIATLGREIPGLIAVEPKEIGGDKIARLSAVSGFGEAGNVWFPDVSIAPWIGGFVEELVTFPNAANDDDVDAMSQALMRLLHGGAGTNFLEYMRQQVAGRVQSSTAVHAN